MSEDEKRKLEKENEFWFGPRRPFREICPSCLSRGTWMRAAFVCPHCHQVLGA